MVLSAVTRRNKSLIKSIVKYFGDSKKLNFAYLPPIFCCQTPLFLFIITVEILQKERYCYETRTR